MNLVLSFPISVLDSLLQLCYVIKEQVMFFKTAAIMSAEGHGLTKAHAHIHQSVLLDWIKAAEIW